MTLTISAKVEGKELLRKFLQHVRNFEVQHREELDLTIVNDCPELTTREIEEIVGSLVPPMGQVQTFKGGKA